MAISYDKMWKLLIDKKMKRKDLKMQSQVSQNIMAKLGRDEPVSMETMEKICKALKCNIGDIMEFVSRDNN